MGKSTELIENRVVLDNSDISIFSVRPAQGAPIRGGLVLIQEIFGVNSHIRNISRRFAEFGFSVYAPAYFDHVEKNVELGYDAEGIARGRVLMEKLGWEQALIDTKLAAIALKSTLQKGRQLVATVGYCWGGSLSWLAACRLGGAIDASVCYYGRQTFDFRDEKPRVPVIAHFGLKDPSIPMSNVEAFQKAQPQVPVYLYDAGHGFSCDERKDFNAEASALALERTLGFFKNQGL